MGSDSVGEFEHQVLLAVLRLGEGAYTSTIVLELERCAQRTVAVAAVYVALRRLEADGLLRARLKEGQGASGKRERRYVTVTPKGLAVLAVSRERLLRLWDGLEPLLERS